LAVNGWPIDKVFELIPGLEKESLFDMNAVASMSHVEVFYRLERAGYSRGDLITGLLTERLLSVAGSLSGEGLNRLCTLLEQNNTSELDTWLLGFRGIGPHVLWTFKMLQKSS